MWEVRDGRLAYNWVERSAYELFRRLTSEGGNDARLVVADDRNGLKPRRGSPARRRFRVRGAAVVAERVFQIEPPHEHQHCGGERRGEEQAEAAREHAEEHLREDRERWRERDGALLHERGEDVAVGHLQREVEREDGERLALRPGDEHGGDAGEDRAMFGTKFSRPARRPSVNGIGMPSSHRPSAVSAPFATIRIARPTSQRCSVSPVSEITSAIRGRFAFGKTRTIPRV